MPNISTIFSTLVMTFSRCLSLHDHANFLCTAKLSKDVLPLNLVSVLLCSLNQILLEFGMSDPCLQKSCWVSLKKTLLLSCPCHPYFAADKGPKYVENISSRSLKKPSDLRKLRLLSVYFSIFWVIEFTGISKIAILLHSNLAKLEHWSI